MGGCKGVDMKAISYKEHEKWESLTSEEQKKITDELWGFLYGHDEEVVLNVTPLHLIALFIYDDSKIEEVSELILTDLWENLEQVSEAIEVLKTTNIKELCETIKSKLEDMPDARKL
jgi:hypothetical protein